MAKKLYVDIDKAVGMGYLSDWYQSSIDDTKPPIWTDEHIYELVNDFLIIPNDTPTADVEEVVRCGECKHFMEYNEDYVRKVEKADGDCYIRKMYSCDPQFCAVKSDDFCSYGKRK